MFAPAHSPVSWRWRVGLMLAADGRTFTVTVPGMGVFRSGFAARVQLDGQPQDLSSEAGTVVAPTVRSTETTPSGQAEVTETTIRFAKEQVDLMLRLGRVPGVPGVLAQAGIRNAGPQPVNLASVTPLAMEFAVAGSLSDWLVTSLDTREYSVCNR